MGFLDELLFWKQREFTRRTSLLETMIGPTKMAIYKILSGKLFQEINCRIFSVLFYKNFTLFIGCYQNCSSSWGNWPWNWRYCYIWKERNSQNSDGTRVACGSAANWSSCWFNCKCWSSLPRRVRTLNLVASTQRYICFSIKFECKYSNASIVN